MIAWKILRNFIWLAACLAAGRNQLSFGSAECGPFRDTRGVFPAVICRGLTPQDFKPDGSQIVQVGETQSGTFRRDATGVSVWSGNDPGHGEEVEGAPED